MVLHLLAFVGAGFQQGPSPALMEQCRIEADRLMGIVCRTDRGGQLDKYLKVKSRVEFRASRICVWYINGSAIFDMDGSLGSLNFTPYEFPHELQPKLSDREAKDHAMAYAKRLGVPLANAQVSHKARGSHHESVFRPTRDGVPFDTAWYLTIERESGFLLHYMTGRIPQVYGPTRPSISPDQARASAVSAITRYKEYDQYVVSATDIVLQVPSFFPGPKEMTEEQVSIARAGKAIPVYIVRIDRGESWSEEKGGYREFDLVYVDGRNGRALAIVEISKFLMTSGGAPTKATTKRASVLIESKPIGIRTKQRIAWFKDWKFVDHPKGQVDGASLTLHTESGAVGAQFDPESELILVRLKGQSKWIKPTKEAMNAVRWRIANPPKPFGRLKKPVGGSFRNAIPK